MRRFAFLAVLVVGVVSAQAPPDAPPTGAQPIEIIEIKPDTPIATVNGKKLTAGEFELLLPNLPQQLRELAATEPQKFFEQYALGLILQREAESMKLDQQTPYREKLADARRQILVQAVMAEKAKAIAIQPEEIQKIYESRGDGYRQANTKVIFVTRVGYEATLAGGDAKTTRTPEQSKAIAEKAIKDLRGGRDFVEAAKEYSDDKETTSKGADFPYPIRANADNVPQQIRDAVTKAKPGEIVGPVEHDTGWYIFRIEDVGVAPLDAVKADIEQELRNAAVQRFIQESKKKSSVTLDHDPFWKTFLAANKEARERLEKQQAESK